MADRTLACSDCGKDFVFSEAEQEFFRERGFDHDPKRCVECRRGRRRRFQARASGGERSGNGDANGAGRHERSATQRPRRAEAGGEANAAASPRAQASTAAMHTTVCSSCEQETEVPFRPDGVRPVYCMPCLKQQTR